MARGWESKSVEAQQDQVRDASTSGKRRLTPEEADRAREKESLQLSLKRILEQLNHIQNDRHRQMLEDAMADLKIKIKTMDS